MELWEKLRRSSFGRIPSGGEYLWQAPSGKWQTGLKIFAVIQDLYVNWMRIKNLEK